MENTSIIERIEAASKHAAELKQFGCVRPTVSFDDMSLKDFADACRYLGAEPRMYGSDELKADGVVSKVYVYLYSKLPDGRKASAWDVINAANTVAP